MTFIKLDQADLDYPCRELSNGGLKIIAALKIFCELIFRVFILGEQSSYIMLGNNDLSTKKYMMRQHLVSDKQV